MSRPTPRRTRRSQADRTAATRGALLDATIDSLVEHGYAGLTTSRIVDAAGVTRGAQAHHFATRAELVVEALAHLTHRIQDDLQATPLPPAESAHEQLEALLDRWWEVFSGPLFLATAELWVASRTDEELRGHLQGFARGLNHEVVTTSAAMAPLLAARTDLQAVVVTAIAAITGLALVRFVGDDAAVELMWSRTRSELLTLVP